MSDSIRLHPKHGLNATIPVCFLCGKDKNEIALLGAAYHDEAPMHMCIDKSPCDECRGYMEQGVLFVCVQDNTDQSNPYRMGKIAVLKVEAAKRIFPNLGENRAAFVEETVWKKLGLPE
jgi:hypothetical protein